jgi:acyl phosphate:glycerol-3-phosphate acyltransferase
MFYLIGLLIILVSYLLGSIPFGLLIVKLSTGKDIREVESGRTGATNAMRAAGFWAGALTISLDFLKGLAAVWLVRWLIPADIAWRAWLEVLAPLAAILGHNYSIFLARLENNGKLRLRGGAGGATSVGGGAGLWLPSAFITIPTGLLVLFGVGYASVATMSVPLVTIVIFAYRAWIGASPWEYIFYGIGAEIILIIALRPNIERLLHGNERLVGWRARRKQSKESKS